MNSYASFDEKTVNYIKKCQECWLNVAEGGKRGGKNVDNALAFCIALDNHPDKFFLLAGVDQSSARINISECDGYGVKNYFYGRCKTGKFEKKDCLFVNARSGQKILFFAGGRRDGDEANIKGYTYGMAYVTEANECHKKFLKEVDDRTLSSNNRKIFHDLNPKSPNHSYYTEYLAFHEKQQAKDPNYGYNYGHFNIFNNLSISDEKLRDRLRTYDKNSIWYKRDILGLRIASTGVLFGEIANNKTRYLTTERLNRGMITTGVDFGKNGSKHAFCTQEISRDYHKVCVLRSDEVDCKNSDDVLDDGGIGKKLKQLEVGFIKHIKYCLKKYGHIDVIWADSAEPSLIDFLVSCLKKNGLSIPVKPSIKIPISDRIYMIGLLLMQDRINFMQGETDEIITALQEAMQDENSDEDRYLDDGTSDIDILDGLDYGIEYWYRQLIRVI